jgi:hypothetical protein
MSTKGTIKQTSTLEGTYTNWKAHSIHAILHAPFIDYLEHCILYEWHNGTHTHTWTSTELIARGKERKMKVITSTHAISEVRAGNFNTGDDMKVRSPCSLPDASSSDRDQQQFTGTGSDNTSRKCYVWWTGCKIKAWRQAMLLQLSARKEEKAESSSNWSSGPSPTC